jgi:crotonobetainyl-CoA:carnitine CoA-transferase CaiB-like acyl-CoA transferase
VEDLIKPAFESWSRSRSRADVVKTMTAAGVPTALVHTAEDLADDAGMVQREMMVDG